MIRRVTAGDPQSELLDFRSLFEAAPSPNLIVRADPPRFTIVAANDAYLAATMTTRERIVGRPIFEAFPGNPDDPEATGVSNVRASIEYVIAHRQPHTMAVQRYDVPRPDGGGFEEKYWSPIHTPVFGPNGKVAYVIQRPEDVTEFVRLKAREGEQNRRAAELQDRAERMEAEVFLRAQELARANADLRRQVEERERAEAALAREQAFLRAVLDHAADGIVACDGDGVLRFFNRAARAFHGVAEQPLPPERWAEQYDLYLPDGRTRMTKEQVPLFRALAEGAVKDAEMVIAADGHPPRLLSANGRAITDAEGRKLGAVVVMHDLTARKQAEEQRERAVREEAGRKGAEASAQRLRESEERFRRAMGIGTVGVLFFSLDGSIHDANAAFERMSGYSVEELRRIEDWAVLTEPGFLEPTARTAGELATAGVTAPYEKRMVRKDGTRWWGLFAPTRMSGTGRDSRCVEFIIDITQAKEAEEALRASEERLRAVFRQTEAGIAQADLTGRFVLANERYAQIVGRSREELLTLRMQDITHPDDLPDNLNRFERAVRDGTPFVSEKRYVRPDGSEVWVSNSVSLMRDRDGGPSGVIAATVDITDRRRAEQVLRESEQHARRIIDNTLSFVGVMTPDGTLTEANATALHAGGLRREDVVGRKFWDCYWWAYDPDVQARLRDAVGRAAGGEVVRYDVTVRMAGDTRMPIDFMLSPVRDNAGRVTHLIPSGVDIRDRLRAEEEVRNSQRQLASVIDNAPSAIFIKDVRGRYLLVNAPFERMAGVAVGSMTGKADADLFPPEVAAQFRDEDERVAREDGPVTFEESFEFRGDHRTLVTNKFPLRDGTGAVYAVCGIATDVTALKRAEAAVRESEQRLRLGLRAGRTGTWDWDIVANRVVWSEQVYEFHGLRPDEFGGTGEDFAKLVHPEDRERVWSLVQAALHEGKPYEVEFRTVRPTGEVRWLSTTGQVTRDGGGRPVRMMGALIDSTDRKNAEAERERLLDAERAARAEAETLAEVGRLVNGELELHALVQKVTDATTDLTRAQFGAFFYNVLNEKGESYALYTLSGVPREAFASFPMPRMTHVFGPTFRGEGVVRSDDVTKDERYGRNAPYHGMPDGHLPVRSYLAVPVTSRSGEVLGGLFFGHAEVGVFTDRDERLVLGIASQTAVAMDNARLFEAARRANAAKDALLASEQAARSEAERASRMKDEFLATLSHELRTPLNAILGWSQILAHGTKDEADLAEGLRVIERNARAQTQIIEDLLDMSRIISGKVRLDVQRLDLAAVVRGAIETTKPAADAKGVRLQAVLDPHAGPVSGDPARLQQVMWNLLSNAVKFTPRGGRVQVLLERVNSHLEVSVIDTGEGIRPEFLPYAFDRFRQADSTTTRRHGGLGLGLSIVKQLVELHGGSIRVKSAGLGHGSTFIVALPLTVIHPEPDTDVERHHPRAATAGPRDTCVQIAGVKVLVVDDEADARALVKRLLEDCGAEVVTAGSAAEALELVGAEKPDVLLTDIGMPDADGYSLIRRVRALGPEHGGQVPAAALTAYARAEDRVKAVLAGFQMHLAKPVEPTELIATVAGLAGRVGSSGSS
jgi:PAS domain S-box-containing protein